MSSLHSPTWPRSRLRAVRTWLALACLVLCATTAARSAPLVDGFVSAGGTTVSWPGIADHTGWLTLRAGLAVCPSERVAIGVAAGWDFVGDASVIYFPPGDDFLSAEVSLALAPVTGFVRLRFPHGPGWGVPYVSAGYGVFVESMRSSVAFVPNWSRVVPGLSAAVGLAGHTGAWAPVVELRYDVPAIDAFGGGGTWTRSSLQMVSGSLGLQLP